MAKKVIVPVGLDGDAFLGVRNRFRHLAILEKGGRSVAVEDGVGERDGVFGDGVGERGDSGYELLRGEGLVAFVLGCVGFALVRRHDREFQDEICPQTLLFLLESL